MAISFLFPVNKRKITAFGARNRLPSSDKGLNPIQKTWISELSSSSLSGSFQVRIMRPNGLHIVTDLIEVFVYQESVQMVLQGREGLQQLLGVHLTKGAAVLPENYELSIEFSSLFSLNFIGNRPDSNNKESKSKKFIKEAQN